ncbi:hypothetical protein FB468_2549 [Leucobacter komagatae]|uniref:Uncharacterized protein n=1 Tax=Leucobacter komagatae TaxID=55969 RepID=A0A542Y8T3_9MICO|nr:hypothetical protein FB468_2549 [Leucobacter komagatae]
MLLKANAKTCTVARLQLSLQALVDLGTVIDHKVFEPQWMFPDFAAEPFSCN